jgi:hypothetical protein
MMVTSSNVLSLIPGGTYPMGIYRWVVVSAGTNKRHHHLHPRYMRSRMGQLVRRTASYRVRGEAPCQVPCVAALHFPKHCSWACPGKLDPVRHVQLRGPQALAFSETQSLPCKPLGVRKTVSVFGHGILSTPLQHGTREFHE